MFKEFKEFIATSYDSPWQAVGEAVAWLGIGVFIITASMIWG